MRSISTDLLQLLSTALLGKTNGGIYFLAPSKPEAMKVAGR